MTWVQWYYGDDDEIGAPLRSHIVRDAETALCGMRGQGSRFVVTTETPLRAPCKKCQRLAAERVGP